MADARNFFLNTYSSFCTSYFYAEKFLLVIFFYDEPLMYPDKLRFRLTVDKKNKYTFQHWCTLAYL